MGRDDVVQRIKDGPQQLASFGVASLHLFGSVARGDADESSDIDLLVAFDGPATFDQYMDLKLYLEDLLGRRVDLVTERGLRDEIRPHLVGDLLRVA